MVECVTATDAHPLSGLNPPVFSQAQVPSPPHGLTELERDNTHESGRKCTLGRAYGEGRRRRQRQSCSEAASQDSQTAGRNYSDDNPGGGGYLPFGLLAR